MLLEMTRCDPREIFTLSPDGEAGPRTPRSVPGEGRSPHADRIKARAPAVDHDMWLVGLRTRAAGQRDVWLFYIVDQAYDADHAVHLALARANSAPERAARAGALVKGGHVEVHQIHRDELGRLSLVRYI
ncbi:hypothetical protein ACFYXS_33845 [Streptomyces sp. NPDC002574]|uniref:hypothetical protein n=1 Tax=Streptomyces sp. NPDC002574 TaxID=3364652 RepID=UPI0036ABBB38